MATTSPSTATAPSQGGPSSGHERSVPLARRQLLHEPLKLGLAFVGVALAVALVGLLFGLREGINKQVTTYEDNAGADVYVGAPDSRSIMTPGSAALPASLVGRLRAVPGVEEAAPLTSGLTIFNLHDKRVASLLIGFEPGALGGPWELAEGSAPLSSDEIAVDSVMAEAHGIHVGDHLELRGRQMMVVGLTDRTASWMTPLTFVTRETANQLQGRGDTASFFLIRSDGDDGGRLASEIDARFPALDAQTSDEIGQNSRRLLADTFNAPLLIMVLISLGIGAMVIGLSAYGFVSERRREYGALKAVGTRNRSLYRLVGKQALALAAVGLVSGVLVARLAAWGIHAAWPKFLFVSLPSHYGLLIAAALVMALLGGLVPARVLGRLDPAEVFRR